MPKAEPSEFCNSNPKLTETKMNIKRMLLVLAAALLLPGLAQAGSTVATLDIHFNFDDDNKADSTTLYKSCDGGLPLNDDTTVEDDDDTVFVIEFSEQGQGATGCDVWVGDVAGYTSMYTCSSENGISCSADNTGSGDERGCRFTDAEEGEDNDNCDINLVADLVQISVTKDWVVLGNNSDTIPDDLEVVIKCDNYIQGFNSKQDNWKKRFFSVNEDAVLNAMVSPDWQGTRCWAEEKNFDSRVEEESTCGTKGSPDMIVFPNSGLGTNDSTCKLTNTLFFEGIPTLNQYGLAIMALLMLGVGFIGFRRFV
jgi:hypothetical protein